MKKAFKFFALSLTILVIFLAFPSSVIAESDDLSPSSELITTETSASSSEDTTSVNDLIIYQLSDSTLYAWDTSMQNYNCYSYVLGITSQFHEPGDFSNNPLPQNYSLNDIVVRTKNDLKSSTFGYSCVKVTTSRPSNVPSDGLVICTRITSPSSTLDFHFMILRSGSWYHKPGNTAVLKYNYQPTPTRDWLCEGVSSIGLFYYPDIIYSGTIKYFVCKPSHNVSSEYTGTNFHKGGKHFYQYRDVCQSCGEESFYTISIPCSGPPCNVIPNSLIFTQ